MKNTDPNLRILREQQHAQVILEHGESNWGWHTPAGIIRKQRRLDFLTENVNHNADALVLEIGCGTGTFTEGIGKKYKNLIAIDISETLLDVAMTKIPDVQFQKRDAHNTEFPDNHFDLILGCSVLHHLVWDEAFTELYRILKPGGQIRFSEPNLLNPQIFLQKNWPWLKRKMGDSPDEYAFTQNQAKAWLKQEGFINIEVRPFEFLHPHTPEKLIPLVIEAESTLENSVAGKFAGSIKIVAEKPKLIKTEGSPDLTSC